MTQQQQEGFVVYNERAGIGAENYKAPRLFERFVAIRDDEKRWQYLRDELVAMARNGGLYLTDILNQDSEVSDACGDVLYNRVMLGRTSHKQHYYTAVLPSELTARCIRVKSLNGSTISWCQDMVGGAPISRGRASSEGARRVESQRVETNQKDVMLTPQEAWLCLKESGKFVVRAKRADHQGRVWKCEEVRPEGAKIEEPAAPKAKKSFAEANRQ